MRKRDSKRRWIARFRAGRDIPYLALLIYPDLEKRLHPRSYLMNRDAFYRSGFGLTA